MNFVPAKNRLQFEKSGEKRVIERIGSAGGAGSPESFWSLQESARVEEAFQTPYPCKRGAADLKGYALPADSNLNE